MKISSCTSTDFLFVHLEFRSTGFCRGKKTREPGEKHIWSKPENQQQTQPTQATLVGW